MNNQWLTVGVNFVLLLLLQVFVCNAIYLGIYINLQIYLIFILFLPAQLSRSFVLFLSTLMGFSVDILSGDLGLHMAACTAMGYLRPFLLKRLTTATTEQIEIPPLNKTHFGQYFIYTGILILLHHLILFTLETFELNEMLFILTRTLVSACCNIILIGFVRQLKIAFFGMRN